MAKVQTIRRRIKSVRNINQITKAMEMVAASKLRRTQDRTLRSRLYASAAREALGYLRALVQDPDHNLDLFARRQETKSRLLIIFSSDRGLAGAYNSNLFRALVEQLKTNELKPQPAAIKLIVIGNKGAQFAARLKSRADIVGVYTNWPIEPSSADLSPIVKTALDLYRTGSVDSVSVLFTDFISTIRQSVTIRELLPINPKAFLSESKLAAAERQAVLFEPSPADVLSYIVPRFIATQIYQANLEALASEQAMRMLAMKSASDNARDLISDLTLTYNGARQSAITQELAEISAGTAAIQ